MKLYTRYIWPMLLLSLSVVAQTPAKVGSLITADRYIGKLSNAVGPHKALLEASDQNSIFFKPAPVKALEHLQNRPNIPDVMNWTPVYAKVAKSMEWGVTCGPMDFQRVGARKRYGQYLCIWKRDKKGVWKIAWRAETEHHEPKVPLQQTFEEPDDTDYVKVRSKARLSQREDIIFSTDQLMGTVLKADNATAYKEFLATDARLLMPWQEPIVGKEAIQSFLKKSKLDITTTPVKVDRAYSGELAFSYGDAVIAKEGKQVKYHYLRVWEVQSDFQWNVVVEMFIEK
jgi:ketosteroid isomerase-like protein